MTHDNIKSVAFRVVNKMTYAATIQIFFKCFYYLGFSPLPAPSQYPKHCGRLAILRSYIPLIVHLTVVSGTLVTCLVSINISVKTYNLNEIVILNITLSCEMVYIVLSLLQFTRKKFILYEILQSFHELDMFFNKHFDYRIPHVAFRRRYLLKLLMLIAPTAIHWSLCIIYSSLRDRVNAILLQLHLLQVFTYASIMHTAFYIDQFSFYIDQLIAVMKRDAIQRNSVAWSIVNRGKSINFTTTFQRIQCYKIVHLRLWGVGERLNYFFGWSISAQFLYLFVNFVHSSYIFLAKLIGIAGFMSSVCTFHPCNRTELSNNIEQMFVFFLIVDSAANLFNISMCSLILVNTCHYISQKVAHSTNIIFSIM